MWECIRLKPKNSCTKADVQDLKYYLDFIRQAMVQKTAGQRKDDSRESVLFDDLGTYVNCAVCSALALYVYGGLDVLEEVLPEEKDNGHD
jgi:hypothetical protein